MKQSAQARRSILTALKANYSSLVEVYDEEWDSRSFFTFFFILLATLTERESVRHSVLYIPF